MQVLQQHKLDYTNGNLSKKSKTNGAVFIEHIPTFEVKKENTSETHFEEENQPPKIKPENLEEKSSQVGLNSVSDQSTFKIKKEKLDKTKSKKSLEKKKKGKSDKKKKLQKDKKAKDNKSTKVKDVKIPTPKIIKNEVNTEEEYAWWLEANSDNTIKWETLSHNGVLLAPDYVPHKVPLIYDGQKIVLQPEAEEVAGFFAALLETDYAKNKTFIKNFFKDFRDVLKENKIHPEIKDFNKCDFTLMFNYFQKLKEQKKLLTKEEKKRIKEEKDKIDQKYMYAILNGRKEKVGNFRVEPPGLFRGRGDHPKTGCLKKRVYSEQITINIGKEANIPEPPKGHHWGDVIHQNTVAWLATWRENVNGNTKYVLFAAASSIKGQSDMMKFEKARKLKGCIDKIRKNYLQELKSANSQISQRATAMYFIDRLALRAGNEKGEDEADTVGCCSLRCEHVENVEPSSMLFDFLGKDSIRYYNEVEVIEEVYKNVLKFKKEKNPSDLIFDKLSTSSLNNYLNSLMDGLTAKVFRTYNASNTFQIELQNTPKDASVHDKMLAYNRANRQVAVLCNHQRSVSKGFEGQMTRLIDKVSSYNKLDQRA